MSASADDMLIAAEWLEYNEGDGGEADACKRVVGYLREQAKKKEANDAVARIAKENGVSKTIARKALLLYKQRTA